MSSPNTSFLRSLNGRNKLKSDFGNNRFGNRRRQGVLTSFFHYHFDVDEFTSPMNEHSNYAPSNLGHSFHSQNLAKPWDDTHNIIDPASFQVQQNLSTDFKFNCFDKNILETEYQRFSQDMDYASRPEPDGYRKINEKLVYFDMDPIPVAEDQVSTLETSTKRKHSLANHSYIDFSRVEDEKVNESSSLFGEQLDAIINFGAALHPSHVVAINDVKHADNANSVQQNRITFPTKLMSLLDNNPDPNVITWLPHGRAFIVKDNKRFVDELSSSLCKSNNFKSFQRMLNIWGFKRLTGKRDKGAYYHQLFLKGMPNLVKKMSICKKKNGVWPLANPASEPDFYQLSKLRPLYIA